MKKLTLKDLVYNKKFLIAISIITSVAIWFVAAIVRNPTWERPITDVSANITLKDTVAEKNGLSITSDVSGFKFTVTIKGPTHIVSTVQKEDFILKADVSNVSEPSDNCILKIVPERASAKSGYEFVSVEPSTVTVKVDRITTQEYDVDAKITGVSAVDGLIAETPQINDINQRKLKITGPLASIEKVSSVVALVELDNTVLLATKTFDADIVLYDSNGKIIYRYKPTGEILDKNGEKVESPEFSLDFTTTKVTQAISKKKTLDVNVRFNNIPLGMSKEDIVYSLDKTKATIIGPADVIDSMEKIDLKAIDFSTISTDKSRAVFEVEADLVDNVHIFGTTEDDKIFNVRINVSGYAEKVFDVTNNTFSGLESGLVAKAGAVKGVKICGPKSIVKNITANDLYISYDLSGKSVGTYNINGTVKSNKFSSFWAVGTYSKSVTVSNK